MIDFTTLDVYSTSEKVIGKWIDNRSVYRKVITGTTTNADYEGLSANISNLYAVINLSGCILGSNGIQPIPRVVTDAITTYGIGIGDIQSNGDIATFQHASSACKNRPFILILDYIKSV